VDDLAKRVKKMLNMAEQAGAQDFIKPKADTAMRDFAIRHMLEEVAFEFYDDPDGLNTADVANFVKIMDTIAMFGEPEAPANKFYPEEAAAAKPLIDLYRNASETDKTKIKVFHHSCFYELWDAYREKNPQLNQVEIDDSDPAQVKSVLLAVTEGHAADEIARLYGGAPLENASSFEHDVAKKRVEAKLGTELPWTPSFEMLCKMQDDIAERAAMRKLNGPAVVRKSSFKP